jgi:hypothetical protein
MAVFAFDPEETRRAAQRWVAEQSSREAKIRAIDDGDIARAESQARLECPQSSTERQIEGLG